MAISPNEAAQVADEKKKLTIEEVKQADETEALIDRHIKQSYDGGKKLVISLPRPAPRVILELGRRYTKAGWGFEPNSPVTGRSGFSITLMAPNVK